MEKHIHKKIRLGTGKSGPKGTTMSSLQERQPGLPSTLDGGFDKMSQVLYELDRLKK